MKSVNCDLSVDACINYDVGGGSLGGYLLHGCRLENKLWGEGFLPHASYVVQTTGPNFKNWVLCPRPSL